jgi:hypothetical protein
MLRLLEDARNRAGPVAGPLAAASDAGSAPADYPPDFDVGGVPTGQDKAQTAWSGAIRGRRNISQFLHICNRFVASIVA